MEGLVGILPETGLAEAVTLGTAEVAAGRTLPLVIEAGEGRTAFLAVLPFVAVTGGIGEGPRAEGLVRVLPEAGLAETVAVGTAEVAAGSLVLLVIESGKGTGALPGVLSFAAVAVVEAPGTEAVLAERLSLIVTARTEGTPGFFAIAIHETVATGTEGTFVLSIPAEGRAGLRGLVAVTGGIGEGARAEGLVHILPEAGLAETVAVGMAEIAAGRTLPLVIEAGEGRLAVFPEVAAALVPGGQAVSAAAFVAPARGGVFPAGLAGVAFVRILGCGPHRSLPRPRCGRSNTWPWRCCPAWG